MLQDLIFQQTLRQYFPRWMVSIYSWVPNKYPPLVNFWIFFQPPNAYLHPPSSHLSIWNETLVWSGLSKLYRCVKSVRIRSYSGSHFPRIFPHPYSFRMQEKCGPEWLQIRTLFTQCITSTFLKTIFHNFAWLVLE